MWFIQGVWRNRHIVSHSLTELIPGLCRFSGSCCSWCDATVVVVVGYCFRLLTPLLLLLFVVVIAVVAKTATRTTTNPVFSTWLMFLVSVLCQCHTHSAFGWTSLSFVTALDMKDTLSRQSAVCVWQRAPSVSQKEDSLFERHSPSLIILMISVDV